MNTHFFVLFSIRSFMLEILLTIWQVAAYLQVNELIRGGGSPRDQLFSSAGSSGLLPCPSAVGRHAVDVASRHKVRAGA
jgi:hypothetical protein